MSRAPDRWLWWILLLAALPRLVNLTAPPIGHHGWRQADTAAVARNFHQGGYRLLRPEVDWEIPGEVEMELPLYPWAVALGYAVVGERIWLARAASAAASVATVLFLLLVAGRGPGGEAARWAAVLWSILPLTVFFGRAVMPESWMLAASVAGVYCFTRWSAGGGWRPLLAATLLVGLAALLKPTSLYLGLPLLWLARHRLRASKRARWQVAAGAGLVAAAVCLWYWHAYRLGTASGATFGILSAGSTKIERWHLLLDLRFYHRVFLDFFAGRLLTWPGFALFLLGLLLPRRDDAERLFDWWLAGAAIVLLLACGGSFYHEYYALPLVVPAVAHMGRALAWIRRRSPPVLAVALVALIAVAAWRMAGYLAMEREHRPGDPAVAQDLRVADLLRRHSAPSDRVLSCDSTDPTWLYLSRRKGWGRVCGQMDKNDVVALRDRGARLLVARHADLAASARASRLRDHLLHHHRVLHDDGELVLVELAPLAPSRLPWRPLLVDDFEDDSPPGDWILQSGRWEEQDGGLTLLPTRRRGGFTVAPSLAGCGPCGLRVEVTVEPVGAAERRRLLGLRGWQAGDRYTEAVFDYTSSRLTLSRIEGGVTVAATATSLPGERRQPSSIELDFDRFDFRVFVDSRLVLTLRAADGPPPSGAFGLTIRNLRMRLEELVVAAPRVDAATAAAVPPRTGALARLPAGKRDTDVVTGEGRGVG